MYRSDCIVRRCCPVKYLCLGKFDSLYNFIDEKDLLHACTFDKTVNFFAALCGVYDQRLQF